jgi:ABC-2 type transport system permease protein
MWQRIFSIIVKECIEIGRDQRTLIIILAMPLIQMIMFGYVFGTDIKHTSMVIWDASNTAESRDLVQSFRETDALALNYYARNYADITRLIESNDAKIALVIPPDYATKLNRRETATVQLFTDGSQPTVGLQALSSATAIIQAKGASLMSPAQANAAMMPLTLESRIWYNPALQSSLFYIPGLIGFILGSILVMLTAFSIVRERENGTIEQLNVSPLRRGELIVGKLIPYIFIAYAQVALILVTAVFVFGMPIRGSVWLLLTLAAPFLMFSLGIGLIISSVSRTQMQATQTAQLIMLPSVMLSGFMFPVESMPLITQWLSALFPLTYFLRVVRGIIVKGVGIESLWPETIILVVMGVLSLVIAALMMRKTLS